MEEPTMYSYPIVTSFRSAPALAGLLDALVEDTWRLPAASAALRCDVYTDKSSYFVDVELPGVKKSNVKVRVENDVLRVEAERTVSEKTFWFLRRERPVGKVEQSFRLGQNLDTERMEASFEDGVLHVAIPLKAAAMGREIAVK